jgi:hypothetical protein
MAGAGFEPRPWCDEPNRSAVEPSDFVHPPVVANSRAPDTDPPCTPPRRLVRLRCVSASFDRDWRTRRVPSDPPEILLKMGELSDQRPKGDYEAFVSQWLAPLVAVFLRAVRDAALAYDLATETLAAAHFQWGSAPSGDAGVGWVLRLGAHVLDVAVERGRVPATERRRGRQPRPRRLTVAEQQEIMALAEQHLALPDSALDAADALARMAPPPHVLAELQRSDLVEAEPLPDIATNRERAGRGA